MRTLPLALSAGLFLAALARAAAPPVDYSRDVRPILANACYACHGPDEKTRKAGLRLDLRESAVRKAIKPGDPAASSLIERIVSTDPDEVMPPPASKKPAVSPAQLAILKRWVAEGAKFDQHWAYTPPARAELPAAADPAWASNPVDRFVLARLTREGLKPAPEADRRTLARRLAFDLTGLPPTPAEVDAFVADARPDAYERYVDKLMASPHFGERLAVVWLDLVRYADTIGYHSDTHRDIAPYRDYVIKSFNDNKPFDRFTVEQLAGDLLPGATNEQRIASGYNKLIMTTEEGGAQAREYLAKYSADRVRNVSSVWMAATVGCAECHDHKYDPYKTRDFYRLAAFFADVKDTPVGRQEQTAIPTPAQEAELKRLDAALATARAALDKPTTDLSAGQAAWEKQALADVASGKTAWSVVRPTTVTSVGGAKFETLEDGSTLNTGPNADKDVYSVTLPAEGKSITGLRLEALTHSKLNGRLSLANGNFVLTGVEATFTPAGGKPTPVKLARAVADFEQSGYPVAGTLDKRADTGWAVAGHETPADRRAVFTFEKPVAGGAGATLTVTLRHESQFAGHNVGRFRISTTAAAEPPLMDSGLPPAVADALAVPADKRSAAQKQALADHYRKNAPELAPARAEVAKLEAERAALVKSFPQTMVAMSGPPRPIRVLPRGNWLDDTGELVTPDVPGFLGTVAPTDPKARATRLDLANWLVSRDNPLTARVFVNRLWKVAFGQGLVRSMEDFGSQGQLPTHPELLDWLAIEFREGGWDVKKTLRRIVTSATYRQSSLTPRPLRERDPANALLARQNRYRLDAEFVRDNALAVSGLLNLEVGGPSVKPYQPAGYWSYLNFPKREWQKDGGEKQYRRGLYTYWCRTFPHPGMVAFDAPSREECTAERTRSLTPTQALVLLNDPVYVEAARGFASRVLAEGGSGDGQRLKWAYRQALDRDPTPAEVPVLTALLEKHRKEYAAEKAEAELFLKVGDLPAPKEVDPAELAAWASVTRVLLNLHETVTRE
jgi:mono/diheme cytochrome c family protein